eukprot:5641749-Amphidinium_carterae.1
MAFCCMACGRLLEDLAILKHLLDLRNLRTSRIQGNDRNSETGVGGYRPASSLHSIPYHASLSSYRSLRQQNEKSSFIGAHASDLQDAQEEDFHERLRLQRLLQARQQPPKDHRTCTPTCRRSA